MTCFTRLASAVACVDRIIEFLSLEEVTESRQQPTRVHRRRLLTPATITPPLSSRTPSNSEPSAGLQNSLDVEEPLQFPIELRHVYTTPGKNGRQTLMNVNAAFPRTSICMVVGPVGCGKTTLLKVILDEASTSYGEVLVDYTSIAYCAQVPWLQNVSIRDNILCGERMHEEWYNGVIFACGLRSDLASLARGDETLAGTDGRNLSGGQRHRVALARAVYSNRRILLLDNIFSSLDRTTSRFIFENLLGEYGILRDEETLVVLVTNVLDHLQYADKVFLLDTSGTTSEN